MLLDGQTMDGHTLEFLIYYKPTYELLAQARLCQKSSDIIAM